MFASATQDIVIDAWRIEAAEVSRQGAMAASYQWGYRIATVAAGALALVIGQHVNWHAAYAAMVLFMAFGLAAAVFAPPEREHVIRPIPTGGIPSAPALELVEWMLRLALLVVAAALLIGSGLGARADLIAGAVRLAGATEAGRLPDEGGGRPSPTASGCSWLLAVVAGFAVVGARRSPSLPGLKTRPGVYLFHALGDPLADFFRRFGRVGILILALICLYRISEFVLSIMNAFYQDLGFTLTQIAEVRKVFGLGASLVGVFIGGLSVARLGIKRSLLIGARGLAGDQHHLRLAGGCRGLGLQSPLFVAIGVDNIVSAYAGTCLIAYMSSLTSAGFTATQYALFSSLYALPGKLIASQSGRIVESAAQAAEPGGPFAPLRALFVHTPPQAFAGALAKSHVDPTSLGAGYVVFFLYSVALWGSRR